jgi:hypothetical protein
MLDGKQNQNKSSNGVEFSLENLSLLTFESGVPLFTETLGSAIEVIGQRKSGIYFWGDSVITWGDALGSWGFGAVVGVNQTRNNLTTKINQIKN